MSNQMTLTDRIAIEAGIAAGKTFKEIAAKIRRNPATISREIKANRTVIPATFYLGCDCRFARYCHKHNICTDMECSIPVSSAESSNALNSAQPTSQSIAAGSKSRLMSATNVTTETIATNAVICIPQSLPTPCPAAVALTPE